MIIIKCIIPQIQYGQTLNGCIVTYHFVLKEKECAHHNFLMKLTEYVGNIMYLLCINSNY